MAATPRALASSASRASRWSGFTDHDNRLQTRTTPVHQSRRLRILMHHEAADARRLACPGAV
jgi:hypothetical protein